MFSIVVVTYWQCGVEKMFTILVVAFSS